MKEKEKEEERRKAGRHGIKHPYEIGLHKFHCAATGFRVTESRRNPCAVNGLAYASGIATGYTLKMPPSPPCDAFSATVAAWLRWLQHNAGRAASTCGKYGQHLQRFGDWYASPPADARLRPEGGDPLAATPQDVELFAGLVAHAQGLSPRARRPLVSALRGFFAWAASNGHRHDDPAKTLPSPKSGRRLPRAMSLASAERLLMAPDVGTLAGMRDAAILFCLAGLGARLSGVLGLNESALLWERDSLTVRVREKGSREREIPAPSELSMLLRAYLAHPELAAINRDLPDGDRVLFVGLRAPRIPPHEYHGERRRLTQRAVRSMIERHAKRMEVPREQANPHALRHLYGAELAEDDRDLVMRGALLGHANPKDTAIYSHLARRKLRGVVDASNPLAKMRNPLLDSLRAVRAEAAKGGPTRTRSGPSNA